MTQEPQTVASMPRTVDIGRGTAWVTEAFGFFQKDALAWLGATVLLFIITVAMAMLPVIGALAGHLLMPVFIGGMMLGCRARGRGEAFQITHLFAGFGQHTTRLMILGLLYMAGIFAIVIAVAVMVIASGMGNPTLMTEIEAGDFAALMHNLNFFLLVLLICAALYLPLLMAYWFAPALVVLRNAGAVDAMKLSFMGCLVNIMPFLLYGIICLLFGVLVIITLGLGLLILFPVITASIYVAYQDIYPEK